ncbi:MAG TPA: formate dehydrogenase [Intrasporangiaceae bacterium]|nr:formate dehydrogenase [Intrasporangiaceae bacterium]
MSTGTTVRASVVRGLAERRATERGPLLPVLHDVVAEHGYIADEDIPVIADVLNLSRADVHGVVSFYHDFRRTPPPAHVIQICRGEACQSVGADALLAEARDRYQDAEDVEVREVFCLGNCALGPSGMVDGRLLGRLTADRLDDSLTTTRRAR